MNKIDGRKMSHEALETIRKIAVQRVQEGESPEVVIRALGFERRTFLILDRHPIHRSARIKKFVEESNGMLQIFYLPPYSPELNPDELVWNCVKRDISRSASKSRTEMKGHTTEALRELQRAPAKVKRLFHEEHVKYAAL